MDLSLDFMMAVCSYACLLVVRLGWLSRGHLCVREVRYYVSLACSALMTKHAARLLYLLSHLLCCPPGPAAVVATLAFLH